VNEGQAQQEHQRGEAQGGHDDKQVGGREGLFLLVRVGQGAVFHEGRVHAVNVNDIQERQVGVDVGVDPHIAAGDEMGVEGDEQEAEKAADDGGNSVNGRILAQFLDFFNHQKMSPCQSLAQNCCQGII